MRTTLDRLRNLSENDLRQNMNLAKDSNTPSEVLDRLSRDESNASEFIRAYVASNKNTLPETLDILVDDESFRVRANIASRRDISSEILAHLAEDRDESVRREVARNVNTPPEALILLSKDWSVSVKGFVATNKNTPRDVVESLTNDKEKTVRNRAIKALSVKENIMRITEGQLRRIIRAEVRRLGVKQ